MEIRTSAGHPLLVSWATVPSGHRIGLTFAPGKHDNSTQGPFRWERDLDADLDRLASFYGVNLLASLLEDHELDALEISDLTDRAAARGVAVRRFPIKDAGVPLFAPALRDFVRELAAGVRSGKTVVVHCRGGLGRTGLVAGCALIELGATPEEAFAAVQAARGPSCPETEAQRQYVLSYTPTAPSLPVAPSSRADRGRRLDRILVVDLECTCWDRGQQPRGQVSEPIELGIAVLDTVRLVPVEKRSILIRPTRSKIGPFCTALTTLTEDDVADGVTFAEACDILMDDFGALALTWASFGDYDRKMLERTCTALEVPWPLGRTHLNVKNLFALALGLPQELDLKEALTRAGLLLEGTQHRGHDDAWNAARILATVLKKSR